MKVKAYLSIGFANADQEDEVEIDDEELEGLSPEERERIIGEHVKQWADNYIEWGWREV